MRSRGGVTDGYHNENIEILNMRLQSYTNFGNYLRSNPAIYQQLLENRRVVERLRNQPALLPQMNEHPELIIAEMQAWPYTHHTISNSCILL